MTINPALLPIHLDFTVRKATNDDCSKVQQLIFNVLIEYGLEPQPSSTDKDLFDLESNYSNGFFGIIEDGSKIVATFALHPISNTSAEIRKMYALPESRGRGLGKWMVGYLLQIAKENGIDEVELETASPLVEAISLYQKLGFQEKAFENNTPRCDKAFFIKLN
ncbi:MAG: putative acetyltransferase [Saprospiraceae bacterium]|jgi:putative acetyltransferase|tara:strand:+ start:766 stop:1257 length:492 start_codon:yes stop_codon:yes gene_type:complete